MQLRVLQKTKRQNATHQVSSNKTGFPLLALVQKGRKEGPSEECMGAIKAEPACYAGVKDCLEGNLTACEAIEMQGPPPACYSMEIAKACSDGRDEDPSKEMPPNACVAALEAEPECYAGVKECLHGNFTACEIIDKEGPPAACYTQEIAQACSGDHDEEPEGPPPGCQEAIKATPACYAIPEVRGCLGGVEKDCRYLQEMGIPGPCETDSIMQKCGGPDASALSALKVGAKTHARGLRAVFKRYGIQRGR